MEIKYFGQNSFLFELENHTVLTDPAMSVIALSKHINKDDISADYILLTHAHGDHIADVEAIGKANNSVIVANFEVASYFGEKGLKYHPMNHGGKWQFEFGTVAMVNAVHSSVFPDGTYGGNPAGFIIMAEGKTIYMAGDTALTNDMKIIPEIYPKLDLAILPIGDNFTMGIETAIIAAKYVQCDNVIGCHYDSFPYIEIDHSTAKEKFIKAGINLTLLEIGESITL